MPGQFVNFPDYTLSEVRIIKLFLVLPIMISSDSRFESPKYQLYNFLIFYFPGTSVIAPA